MTSPAQRHKRAVAAKQAVIEDTTAQASAYELMLEMLGQHKRALKAHKSFIQKNELKAQLLVDWHVYIDELIAHGDGRANAIVGQLMVWCVDVADYARAIGLGRYMLKHHISMPEHFERDVEDTLAEEMAMAWIGSDDPTVTLDELLMVGELVSGFDLFDQVNAKLHRAIGEAYAKADEVDKAVMYLDKAIEFNPNVGCKPLFGKLKKVSAARTEPENTPKP